MAQTMKPRCCNFRLQSTQEIPAAQWLMNSGRNSRFSSHKVEEGQNLNYAIATDVIKKFLFTGMQNEYARRNRDGDVRFCRNKFFYRREMSDRFIISKAIYPDAGFCGSSTETRRN